MDTQAQQTAAQAAQQAARARLQAQQHQPLGPSPQHVEGRFGMLLCRVVLGRIAQGQGGLRRPPAGADSVTQLVGNRGVPRKDQPLDRRDHLCCMARPAVTLVLMVTSEEPRW